MKIKRRITWQYLLDAHGPKIGAALCAVSTVTVMGFMIWMFFLTVTEVTK